ncbi:MAG: hypothetical protein AAGC68_02285 [Verrucomicrobiota bacterium]
MNEKFQPFWQRLTKSAGRWKAPEPTAEEIQRLADDVLRGLRQLAPDPTIWWTPLARRVALVAVVVAFLICGFQREPDPRTMIKPDSLAAAFLAHGLQAPLSRAHE